MSFECWTVEQWVLREENVEEEGKFVATANWTFNSNGSFSWTFYFTSWGRAFLLSHWKTFIHKKLFFKLN